MQNAHTPLEKKRVLKPGEVIVVRDADNGGALLHPSNELLLAWFAIGAERWRLLRGDPWFDRRLRGSVRQAGFQVIKIMASYDVFNDLWVVC